MYLLKPWTFNNYDSTKDNQVILFSQGWFITKEDLRRGGRERGRGGEVWWVKEPPDLPSPSL